MQLPTEHRYKYTLSENFGNWNHSYSIVTRWGAIEFNVTEYDAERMKGHEPSGGLESHFREPPDYMADRAPSHDECWILKQPCWHDGTSMYASEVLIPRWQMRTSEAEVFQWLVSEVDRLKPKSDDD